MAEKKKNPFLTSVKESKNTILNSRNPGKQAKNVFKGASVVRRTGRGR